MKRLIWIFFFLNLFITTLQSGSKCNLKKNCEECLMTENCSFCKQETYNTFRCDTKERHLAVGCTALESIESAVTVTNTEETITTLKQNKIDIVTSPGQPAQVKLDLVKHSHVKLDFYILLDSSSTMSEFVTQIKELSTSLLQELKTLTNDVKIGFSSFVDRPIEPFVNKISNDKASETKAEFLIRQYFALTADVVDFKNQAPKVVFQRKYDKQTALWDALFQVANCNTKVNWRSFAKKIVLIVTDQIPRMTGEEMVANIFNKVTKSCKLHENSISHYQEWSGKDMTSPSLSQIREALIENEIIPIFAHSSEHTEFYRKITEYLKDTGAKQIVVGKSELSAKKKIFEFRSEPTPKIIHAIKEKYLRIIRDITITDTSSENVKVEYKVVCPDKTVPKDLTCKNFMYDEPMNFHLTITPLTCSVDEAFMVLMPGFSAANVTLKAVCGCECSKNKEPTSTKCSGHGTYQCGACECDSGKEGNKCQCQEPTTEIQKKCIMTGTNTLCNNEGDCECGQCQCRSGRSGTHCECNDEGCPQFEGKVCGGHGNCVCGQCECNPGYTGANCGIKHCEYFEEDCLDKEFKTCGNHGICNCGVCNCDLGYEGDWCNINQGAMASCLTYEGYVKNLTLPSIVANKPWRENSIRTDIAIKETCPNCIPQRITRHIDLVGTRCFFIDDGCYLLYSFAVAEDYKVKVFYLDFDSESDCRTRLLYGSSIGITFSTVLLIGICLVGSYKLGLMIYDKVAYYKFLHDNNTDMVAEANNPLYKSAEVVLDNPVYDKHL